MADMPEWKNTVERCIFQSLRSKGVKKAMVLTTALLALAGCGVKSPPNGIQAVTGFNLDAYLGTWHEIARADHSFERGLEQVRAEYSLNKDGSVRVRNTGYDPAKRKWKQAKGKARFTGAADVASLKVSFFGPFYGGYHVFALDPEKYALVTSGTRDYLWILARGKSLPADLKAELLANIAAAGFNTNTLIWVKQE
jgi:apolipoprotein D and lipocalin family protein